MTVCGAMGGEPLYATLLLGLGVRRLSMPPHQLPEIKRVIRAIRDDRAKALAAEVLALESASDVVARLRDALREALPDSHRTAAAGRSPRFPRLTPRPGRPRRGQCSGPRPARLVAEAACRER